MVVVFRSRSTESKDIDPTKREENLAKQKYGEENQ